MNHLYSGKNTSIVDGPVAAATKHIVIGHIKKNPAIDFKNKTCISVSLTQPSPLANYFNRFIKRSFDIIISFFSILFILSWLIPLMAILVKLDSKGPVFFFQKRIGRHGKLFTCLKFRSMFVNAEANTLPEQVNDRRVTRLGKFIRSRHIDELPQFFNVLFGNMSIIGPRPYMSAESTSFEKMFTAYSYRHTVKPGITGFAQSSGNFGATRDLDKMKQRIELDILYIQKWTAAMDAKILVRTFSMLAKKEQGT